MAAGDDPVRQDLGGPRGGGQPALHRPPPGARGHLGRRPSSRCDWPGRQVRRPDRTLATADHNVPTDGATALPMVSDPLSRRQIEVLEQNCREFGVPVYSIGSERQGIVHVIGPELGVTQPGMTIVCGDSHTSTHGAFGALAFGIGTSEVEHVLATQTLQQRKPKSMRILYEGELGYGVSAKDLILGTIGRIGTDGGVGHVIEYAGPPDREALDGGTDDRLQHDDRGRRPRGDDRPRRRRPSSGSRDATPRPTRSRSTTGASCGTDPGAEFDTEVAIDASALSPQVTWGTTPGQVVDVTGAVPEPSQRERGARARVHGARAGHADAGDRAGPRLHRLVHQQPHRRPARGGRGRARAAGGDRASRPWWCPARSR